MPDKVNKLKVSIYPFFALNPNLPSDEYIIKDSSMIRSTIQAINTSVLEAKSAFKDQRDVEILYPNEAKILKHIFSYNEFGGDRSKKRLEDLFKSIEETEAKENSDVVVFYFAGHGGINDEGAYHFQVGWNFKITGDDIYKKLRVHNSVNTTTILVLNTCTSSKFVPLFAGESELNTPLVKKSTRSTSQFLNSNIQFESLSPLIDEKTAPALLETGEYMESKTGTRKDILPVNEEIQQALSYYKEHAGLRIQRDDILKNISMIYFFGSATYKTSIDYSYSMQVICGLLQLKTNISFLTFFEISRKYLIETTHPAFTTYNRRSEIYNPQFFFVLPKTKSHKFALQYLKRLPMLNYR